MVSPVVEKRGVVCSISQHGYHDTNGYGEKNIVNMMIVIYDHSRCDIERPHQWT